MNNDFKIKLLQNFSYSIFRYLIKLKQNVSKKTHISLIEDINYFHLDLPKDKHALIKLSPNAWMTAINEYPNIKYFNYTGFTFEMVDALNAQGYLVDICDVNEEFTPSKVYDIFIGHGSKCTITLDNLKTHTIILQYVSGAFWKGFNDETDERYNAFIKRKNVKEKLSVTRSLAGLVEGEEYLTKKANILFTSNCPRMVETFGDYKDKFFFTGWTAYIDPLLKKDLTKSDFNCGRRNFIYVGGTGGNIQKGMDLLIEAFIKCPDLHLFIYCKVEEEILDYYKNELNLPNIHYIYHWRFGPSKSKLKEMLTKINFTIHAPINTGTGTAFNGSMGSGFIPVGYIDLIAPRESCVLTDSWQIDDLVKCVKEASSKSPEWCKNAAELTIKNFEENWSIESFRKKFNELINRVANE